MARGWAEYDMMAKRNAGELGPYGKAALNAMKRGNFPQFALDNPSAIGYNRKREATIRPALVQLANVEDMDRTISEHNAKIEHYRMLVADGVVDRGGSIFS